MNRFRLWVGVLRRALLVIRITGGKGMNLFSSRALRFSARKRSAHRNSQCRSSVLLLSVILLVSRSVKADSIQVSIDTTVLSGTSGTLAFDFIDGDGVINNSVSIVNFASDATLEPGIPTGSVTGDLPGTVTLSDTNFFNELLVPATLGSSITFT